MAGCKHLCMMRCLPHAWSKFRSRDTVQAKGVPPYVQLRFDRSMVRVKAPSSSPRIYSVRMVGRERQCVLTRLSIKNVLLNVERS